MSISIEEITGEVVPDRRREPRGEQRGGGSEGPELEEKIRAVLVREQRRAERLSDQ